MNPVIPPPGKFEHDGEEGYVTAEGATVVLADELHDEHPWSSPDEAMQHWSNREDLASPNARAYGNGLQQTDDVRARSEFGALGVVAVWRRVTFQASADVGSA